jgi:sulfur-oxidizing protein SoxZ
MVRTLIKAPTSAKRGEVITIHATIGHEMETGFRPGRDGQILPRNFITAFTCHYNEQLVFEASLFPAMAANPYIAFCLVAQTSGPVRLSWTGDRGFAHSHTLNLQVS